MWIIAETKSPIMSHWFLTSESLCVSSHRWARVETAAGPAASERRLANSSPPAQREFPGPRLILVLAADRGQQRRRPFPRQAFRGSLSRSRLGASAVFELRYHLEIAWRTSVGFFSLLVVAAVQRRRGELMTPVHSGQEANETQRPSANGTSQPPAPNGLAGSHLVDWCC